MDKQKKAGEFEGENMNDEADTIWREEMEKLLGVTKKNQLFHSGGQGSGHHGHSGRPGQVGGSSSNFITDKHGNSYEVVKQSLMEERYGKMVETGTVYIVKGKEDLRPSTTTDTELSSNEIAKLIIRHNQDFVVKVEVHDQFQRKGIATNLYRFVEEDRKKKIIPAGHQTEPGSKFSLSRERK